MPFLLIDKCKPLKSYSDMYTLYCTFEECLEKAISLGYGEGSPFPVLDSMPKIGQMSVYMCGDIDISFLHLAPKKS